MRPDSPERSTEACPVCGAHRLTLLHFPQVDPTGVRPYDELLGMGDVRPNDPPGIGCLNCGAEWRDLDSFRAEQRRSGRQRP